MSGMGVLLSQVAEHVPGVSAVVGTDVVISDITHDSRQVGSGVLFVAIRGEFHDGHDYVQMAVSNGASAVLVEEQQTVDVPQIIVTDTRKAMAWAARSVFGMPDETLAIAGVTGTNGKTTVAHMLESILTTAGLPTGIIGTLGARIGSTPMPTARTTPEATDLQRILASMRDSGVEIVLMEVSSHAVELHRADAIRFSVVGFTNLSQDHLDFHGDMETYYAAKKRLFDPVVSDQGVINVDDPWGTRLAAESMIEQTTVSITGNAELSATNLVGTSEGTGFVLVTLGGSADVTLPLVGEFNVSNALVAAGMALHLGVDTPTIARGLSATRPVPGRMEVVPHDGPFTVVVDYAHTPDAIAVVLASLNSLASGRIIAVVGAGGDRDSEKRSIMGAAAARSSNVTIITTDNPRTEDPTVIAEEVGRGARAQPGANVQTIIDRRSAIRHSISIAEAGDIVVVLGKGHEQGQDIGSEVLPFDDRDEVREALRIEGWEPM